MLKPTDKDKIPFKLENPIQYKIGQDFNPYYNCNTGWVKIGVRYGKNNVRGYTPVNQWFGSNAVPFYKELGWKGHNGIDLKAEIGCRVFSMTDGTVEAISESWGAIWIVTDTYTIDGLKMRFKIGYGHLSDIDVEIGQKIKTGDFIGLSGNKGKYTTGPHLHVEVMPQYLNSRGRWNADVSNGYAGCINFVIENINIKYKYPMKHLTRGSIVDAFIRKKVALVVNQANFDKIKAGDKILVGRAKKDHFGFVMNMGDRGKFYELD